MSQKYMRVCRAVVAASLVVTACAPSARQRARGADGHDRGTSTTLVVEKLLHGDTRFDPRERQILERACLAWSEFTSGRARLHIVWDYGEDNYMQIAAARAPHIKRTEWWYAPPNAGGRVNEIGGGEVRLVPENCPGLFPCALHELGHVLGLEHVADVDAVMSATIRAVKPPSRFTEADRRECARIGLCD